MSEDLMLEGARRAAARSARERLLEGIPVRERMLELAGIRTPVLEGGEGPPLVLLHGPGEHAAKWVPVIPELVGTHRVVAPDLPGHGDSDAGDGPLDAQRVLAWLGALVERACPTPPVLVGQVVSGAIAARFAADHGGRLAGLVLVDTLGLVPFAPAPEFGAALTQFLTRPDEITFTGLWRRCAFDLDRLRARMGERWERYQAYSLDRMRAPAVQRALHALMEQFGFPAIPPGELERIRTPTALIWGRHDLATPLAVAEAASARYGWPLQVIEGAADDPAMEQPGRFLEAVRSAVEKA